MDANEIHVFSQAATTIREQFIPMLYGFYKKLVAEGFTEEQAFDLVKAYMLQISAVPHEKI